ncbi:MAG: hypothetical protein CMQ41_01745, partial [Gammaproteobacteria bacterium]|nr:hypothetical protein [Gammaproteobacteria bacterium]
SCSIFFTLTRKAHSIARALALAVRILALSDAAFAAAFREALFALTAAFLVAVTLVSFATFAAIAAFCLKVAAFFKATLASFCSFITATLALLKAGLPKFLVDTFFVVDILEDFLTEIFLFVLTLGTQ